MERLNLLQSVEIYLKLKLVGKLYQKQGVTQFRVSQAVIKLIGLTDDLVLASWLNGTSKHLSQVQCVNQNAITYGWQAAFSIHQTGA